MFAQIPPEKFDDNDAEELKHKLECLLCHATGNKLSKSTYSLETMERAVTDYIEDLCREAEEEASVRAVKACGRGDT